MDIIFFHVTCKKNEAQTYGLYKFTELSENLSTCLILKRISINDMLYYVSFKIWKKSLMRKNQNIWHYLAQRSKRILSMKLFYMKIGKLLLL